jgi:hypothetical protein
MPGRYGRPFVLAHAMLRSSPPRIPWHVYGGEGGQRAVTVQMQCASVVTDLSQDAFGGSSIEHGTTIMQFDLRQRDWQCVLGTTAPICGRQEPSHVDMHALSTFHNPLKYRFIVAQGSYLNDHNQRVYGTPDSEGVSTSQHMSPSILRLACSLAGVCGGSLRHIALLFSALFLRPLPQSSSKRWLDDIGSNLPPPEQRLQQLLALIPVTEGHMDGSYPLGTDHGAVVGKAEHDRMLRTQEAAAEHGDDAQQLLQR